MFINLGRPFGIPLRLHLSSFLFLGILLIWDLYEAMPWAAALLFIIPHEYGHALTGRFFGIATHDVVLWPVGGVARMDPCNKPSGELCIALAGPAITALLALISWLGFLCFTPSFIAGCFYFAAMVNLVILLFNLLPVFPLDGGRAMHAVLSLAFSREKAMLITVYVSQFVACLGIVFFVWLGNYCGVFILALLFLVATCQLADSCDNICNLGEDSRGDKKP